MSNEVNAVYAAYIHLAVVCIAKIQSLLEKSLLVFDNCSIFYYAITNPQGDVFVNICLQRFIYQVIFYFAQY